MKKSTLKQHTQNKKILVTPFNMYLGGHVTFKKWQSRLPNLLWIALIIKRYGHVNGLEKCYRIIEFMEKSNINVNDLYITTILNLKDTQKSMLFDYINCICDNKILDCLCLVTDDKIFRKKFYQINRLSESRVKELRDLVTECYSKFSYLGCDIRFFYAYHQAYIGKLKLMKDSLTLTGTFQEYYKLEHSEPIMDLYRSDIRALELSFSMISEENQDYSISFWEKVGNFSECELYLLDYPEGDKLNMESFYSDVEKQLHNLIANNFENKDEDKFIVISGLFTYTVKILRDICKNNLHNSISSRILLRTIIDAYINIKYLLLIEKEKTNVWYEFQEYGLSKYKLIYKKSIEKYKISDKSHLTPKILEAIVNDNFDEEIMNIDLGYFDKTNIIKKFEEVEEKELYDTIYDYDISYSHAHWGAVRESSLLKCDNTLHQLHIASDEYGQQLSKSTEYDYIMIFVKIMKVISSQYNGISNEFFDKYEVK